MRLTAKDISKNQGGYRLRQPLSCIRLFLYGNGFNRNRSLSELWL